MNARDLEFVPQLRDDFARRSLGAESVVWSPVAPEPVALDPVATVMLDVIDGQASVGGLVADVQEAVGVNRDAAERQVANVIEIFDAAGLLTTSSTERNAEREIADRELFSGGSTPCSENASRLGTVTLSLRLGRHIVRVACDSRRGARRLRAALGDHVPDEVDEAPLGFVLTAPQGLHRNHQLTDRSGFVLSTARGLESGLHALACHLTALVPPAQGTVRVRARTLVADDRAIVCFFPLLFVPTVTERDLQHAGLRLIDRLAIDLDARTGELRMPEIPWPALAALPVAEAHAGMGGAPSSVALVDAAPPIAPARPTAAAMVAAVARNGLNGDVETLLDAAVALVRRATIHAARPGDDQILSVLRELPVSP